jgi:glycerophosphoryl diester phosphodiesterase
MAVHIQRVAHRGGSCLAPENTLAAFRNALTLPVDAIELDVQMSRDGQLIVFHDATVERLTDGTGNILDLDFATLRDLNAAAHFSGNWPESERIPTLSEVLALMKERARVYIEIKTSERDGVYGRYPRIAEAVLRDLRQARMLNRVLVISFDWPMLLYIKSLEPRLQTGANVSKDLWDPDAEDALVTLCQKMHKFGCSWVNMDSHLFTDEMPANVHEQGLKLGLWTVNTLEEMRRFASARVDALTTDRPDLFAEL